MCVDSDGHIHIHFIDFLFLFAEYYKLHVNIPQNEFDYDIKV